MPLFNKNNNGSLELYELSGTFQASTNYAAVATEIASATIDVEHMVGKEVMRLAEEIYNQESPDEKERAFLDLVRRPVAFLAIRNYSKITGLTHGSTGRRLTVGDNEKVPFEWMIDRDDREMQERYYRALDALFCHLMESDDAPEAWRQSPLYRRLAASAVPSLQAMEEVYPVNHSYYTWFAMLPLFEESQEKIRRLVGAEAMERISTTAPCRRYIVLSALITALQRWSITVFPTEVARQFAPSYQGNRENRAATTEEIEWAIAHLKAETDACLTEILEDAGRKPYDGYPMTPKNDPRQKYYTV